MRISTSTLYTNGVYGIQQQQSAISQTQQDLSSGVKSPSEDPVAAGQALVVSQASSINKQYITGQNSANSRLSLNESVLQNVTSLIQNLQTQVVNAGNAALSNSDRASIGTQIDSLNQQLVTLANTTDGTGVYLFSGGMGGTQPFQLTSTGAQYSGDQSKQLAQIGPSQQVQVSLSGADVFQNIQTGNGFFVAQAASANTGTAAIDAGIVANQTSWQASSKDYAIKFSVTAGTTSYNIVDNKTGQTVVASHPYTSGDAIQIGNTGSSVSITGTPADGDTFTITPSSKQSIFATISNLVTALNTPVSSASGNTSLTNTLKLAGQNLSSALNNILTVRAANGSRLNEVTAAQSTSNNLSIQYQTTLAQLQGVDYTQAISNLNQATLALQAAQKSFAQISNLSLFSYIQ